jgi:hypothetical protein
MVMAATPKGEDEARHIRGGTQLVDEATGGMQDGDARGGAEGTLQSVGETQHIRE